MVVATTDYVHHAKMRALWIVTIFYILKARQHNANFTFFEKIDAINFIALHVDVLIFLNANGLEHWTYECDKGARLTLKEPYFFVSVLMNEFGNFNFETLRKYVHELRQLIHVNGKHLRQ